jgi:hypothetical protein
MRYSDSLGPSLGPVFGSLCASLARPRSRTSSYSRNMTHSPRSLSALLVCSGGAVHSGATGVSHGPIRTTAMDIAFDGSVSVRTRTKSLTLTECSVS